MWLEDNRYAIIGDPRAKQLGCFHLVVAPSFACNLRCKHCYLPDHAARTMDWSMVSNLLDGWAGIVRRERGRWGGVFHIKGGEPSTLCYFERLLERVRDLQTVRLMITTNGLSLSDEALAIMAEMRAIMEESVIVTVSIDSSTEEQHDSLRGKGTFQKTWRTVDRLVEAQLPVHVNCLLTRSGKDTICDLLRRSARSGVTQVNLLPFVREGYGTHIPDEWLDPVERYELLETLWDSVTDNERSLLHGSLVELVGRENETLKECVAGHAGLYYVLPDGGVYSCPRLVHSDYLLGHLAKQSLDQIFEESKNGNSLRVPSFGNGTLDASCKGGALGEVFRGNAAVRDQERRVQERVLARMPSTHEHQIAACFSRNI